MQNLFISLGLVGLVIGCGEETYSDYAADDADNSEPVAQFRLRTVVVPPSGDETGSTDAQAIEEALEETTGGGAVVLLPGEYFVNRVIEVPKYSGTFMGAGKTETTINVVESSGNGAEGTGFLRHKEYSDQDWYPWDEAILALVFDFDPIHEPWLDDAYAVPNPEFWEPRQINVMGMTIKIASYEDDDGNPVGPAKPHYNWFTMQDTTTAICNVFWLSGGDFSTRFEDLSIEGGIGDVGGYNLLYPIGLAGGDDTWTIHRYSVGIHLIKNSDVMNTSRYALGAHRWKEASKIKIEGSTFTNTGTGIKSIAHLQEGGEVPTVKVSILDCEFNNTIPYSVQSCIFKARCNKVDGEFIEGEPPCDDLAEDE